MMPIQVKVYELKKGDLFYGWDGVIYRFWDCEYDSTNPDAIKYRVTRYKGKGIQIPMTYAVNGLNVAENLYYRFTHRDVGSFNAGFRTAMKFLIPYMGVFDLENSGMNNPAEQHMTMLRQYKKWKENSEELW